eukprot:GEMP01061263.1.p1 GENE.GEMP01061263.1~~GEMP01061263.1.p1  ORF type:complete len:241 (+),score=45.35 GEMP01061263.1:35-757(+)
MEIGDDGAHGPSLAGSGFRKFLIGIVGAAIVVIQVLFLRIMLEKLLIVESSSEIYISTKTGITSCFDGNALVTIKEATGNLRKAPIAEVEAGHVIQDCDGFSEVFYAHQYGPADVVRLHAGNATLALTPNHLLISPAGALIPAGALDVARMGDGSSRRVARTVGTSDSVTLVYTRSGSLVVNGFCASSWEHFTDYWTSMDTRVLPAFVTKHDWYKTYFEMESSALDPIMHALWPVHAISI